MFQTIKIKRDFEKDKIFIKELRKIDLPPNIEKRKGTYKSDNSGNINVFDYDNMTNISRINFDKEQIYQYGFNKEKYLETKDNKYKKLYKLNKYRLMNLIE